MKYLDYAKIKNAKVDEVSNLVHEFENEMGHKFNKWSETLPLIQVCLKDAVEIKKIGKIVRITIKGDDYSSVWKATNDEITTEDLVEEEIEDDDGWQLEESDPLEIEKETGMGLASFIEDANKVFEKGVLYICDGDNKFKAGENCVVSSMAYKLYMTKAHDCKIFTLADVSTGKVFVAKFDKAVKISDVVDSL